MRTFFLFDSIFLRWDNRNHLYLLFLILVLAVTSCSDPTLNSPFDPDVNTEFPAPEITVVDNYGLAKIKVRFETDYEYFTKFQLERKTEQTSFTRISEILAESPTMTYIDSLINADSLYTYRIRGMADELPGPYSNTMSYSLSITPPVDILAWSFDDHTIGMSWNMSGTITKKKSNSREGYEFGSSVERKIGTGGFTEIARLPSSITGYTDSMLTVNTDYTYKLRTYLNQSYSSYSEPFTRQTQIVQIPTDLNAIPISDQQIELSWQDNCSFETGYRIERKEDTEDFLIIDEVGENVTSYTDEGLLLSINYTYRIQTFTDYNVSDYSNEAGNSTFFPAPYNLTAEAVSDQNIVLEWEYSLPVGNKYIWIKDSDKTYRKIDWGDNRFQQGFSILRREEAGDFEEVGTTSADELTFTDQGLLLGVNYQYLVRAFTDLNYSDGSNMVWEQTFFPAPDNLVGTSINDDTVDLNWNDNCAFEETYHVERSIEWSPYEEIAVLDANTTSFTDTGLEHGPQHFYRVRAGTSLNFSEYSLVDTTITFFPPPTDLVASATSYETIELTWTDNCSFEDGYSVLKNEGSGFYEVAYTTGTSCNIEGLEYGSYYEFYVHANHGTNYSMYSNIGWCTIELLAPTDLTIEVLNDQTLHVQWSAIDSFEEGFSLERNTNGGAFEEIAILDFNIYQYWDSGLIYGNEYTYRVRSFANQYYSSYSNEATSETSFPAPSNLTSYLVSDIEVDLTWQDNCNWEDGYSIERRDAGSNFIEIATVPENTTTFSDETVVYGLEYIYRVCAFTDINFSEYTNETSQLVEIAAPTNLTAAALTSTIIIGWDDNSDIEEHYEIERMTAGNNFVLIDIVSANTQTYIDDDVTNMVTYFYRVRAMTTYHHSEYSNIANATFIGE